MALTCCEVRMRDDVSERLFSLFTSPDRAEAIAGDLMEERETHEGIWFWVHVVRIALALWREAAAEAPLLVGALTTLGCALLIAPAFGGAAAIYLFPRATGSPAGWLALSLCWWSGSLLVGAALVVMAPRRGMAASAILATTGLLLLIAAGSLAWGEPVRTDFLLFYTAGLPAPMLLLAGGAFARCRAIACRTPSMGQR
jgi:hypothetical protein